jgi:hypothetical protein
MENLPKLTKVHFKKGFCSYICLLTITYFKYIYYVKTKIFVTLKTEQDPHWFKKGEKYQNQTWRKNPFLAAVVPVVPEPPQTGQCCHPDPRTAARQLQREREQVQRQRQGWPAG